MFTVRLKDLGGREFVSRLTLTPERWSAVELGGCETAVIDVRGAVDGLYEALNWLGYDCEIYTAQGTLVWWGYVDEASVQNGALTMRRSLDEYANKVAVAYSYTDGNQASQRGTTDWISDASGVTTFGTKEWLETLSEGDETVALTLRAQTLSARSAARVQCETNTDAPRGVLTCRGYWNKLNWLYWSQTAGKTAYEDDFPDEEMGLKAEQTATTISFEASDNIRDSAPTLAWVQAGAEITVLGSSEGANNATWEVQNVQQSNHINVEPDNIVTSGAGASVTIVRGAVRCHKVAQSFSIVGSVAWQAYTIAVQVKRVESPTDSLRIELCSDSSGSPGTVLDSADVAFSTITDGMTWVEATLDDTPTLSASTLYWIVLSRTGSGDPVNYGAVGWSTAAGYADGLVKRYDGSTWTTVSPSVDVPFRVLGKRATTDQVSDIITAAAAHFPGGVTIFNASGRNTLQYRDGDLRMLEEVVNLLRLGTSGGSRLVASVTPEKKVLVNTPPTSTEYVYRMDGRLYSLVAGEIEAGRVIAGVYVDLDLPQAASGIRSEISPVYVVWSEFDASEMTLNWRSLGVQDLVDAWMGLAA